MIMVAKDSIELHSQKIGSVAQNTARLLSIEVDAIVGEVVRYLSNFLVTSDGYVEQSGDNSKVLFGAVPALEAAISHSSYSAVIVAFSQSMVDQVSEFKSMADKMGIIGEDDRELFDGDDFDLLSNYVASSMEMFDSHIRSVVQVFHRFLGKALGEIRLGDLTSGVIRIVRRLSEVEPILFDSAITFFRIIGSLIYRKIEARGKKLTYVYVGPEGKRPFCTSLVGRTFSLDEVVAMDNGQVPGVLENAGGYSCKHWWWAEVA